MKISAVIIAYNEEKNIAKCIKSVDFADEIIVADTGSTDCTTKIARKLGAKIFKTNFNGFSNVKNFAISKASFPWIFSIDADEEATPALGKKIIGAASDSEARDGYYIKRNTIFLGREIRHCGWGSDYQLRFFMKGKGAFDGKPVHEAVELHGKTGRIEEVLLHRSYPDSRTYFEKMNRYTSLQADEKRKGLLLLRMAFAPVFKFFRMYIIRLGFLDGAQGFVLSVYSGFNEFVKSAKKLESRKQRPGKYVDNADSTDRIVIRMPNWLGDAVMATSLLKPLKDSGYGITVLCDNKVKDVFEKNPYIEEIVSFDRYSKAEVREAVAKIRAIKPHAAISLSPTFSAAYMLWRIGSKIRAGFNEDMARIFLSKTYNRDKLHRKQHLTEEFRHVFNSAGIYPDFQSGRQFVFSGDRDFETRTLKKFGFDRKKDNIIAAPFAKYGPAKMWPIEKWEKMISNVLETSKKSFYLAGLDEDNKYRIKNEIIRNKRVKDLRGNTTLKELIYIIKNSNLFIGIDSGIMHIADALNLPVIAMFFSTSYEWTGPINKKARVISANVECRPCFRRYCKYGHYDCMKAVEPDKVANEILKKLI